MRQRKRITVLVALLLAAACAKVPSGPGQAVVTIRASIDDAPVGTKGFVNFVSNDTYGIFTCVHEDTDAPSQFDRFRPSLWNAQAALSGSKWLYRNIADYDTGDLFSAGSEKFILMGRNDNAHADLYAYAPWTKDAYETGPEAIPFSRQSFEFWDPETNTMRVKPGMYEMLIGTSSLDKDLKKKTLSWEE